MQVFDGAGLSERQLDSLAEAGITSLDLARVYAAEHGGFDGLDAIGKVASSKLMEFLAAAENEPEQAEGPAVEPKLESEVEAEAEADPMPEPEKEDAPVEVVQVDVDETQVLEESSGDGGETVEGTEEAVEADPEPMQMLRIPAKEGYEYDLASGGKIRIDGKKVTLGKPYASILLAVRDGLADAGETLGDGTPITTTEQAVCYLIEVSVEEFGRN